MKTIKKQLPILLLIIFCSFSLNEIQAQNLFQEDPSPRTEEAAKETAEMWSQELVLSPQQYMLVEDKIAEFLMKKNSIIQADIPAEEKTRRLKALQIIQFKDMRDILTGPQHRRYVELAQEGVTPTEYTITMPQD